MQNINNTSQDKELHFFGILTKTGLMKKVMGCTFSAIIAVFGTWSQTWETSLWSSPWISCLESQKVLIFVDLGCRQLEQTSRHLKTRIMYA